MPDKVLMKHISQGNQAAFTELYTRYKDRLFYFFFRMLGGCEDTSNDFLQDTFLKIIDKPELYNPSYPFSKWIFSIAHNMCKNEYRKREVRKIMVKEENTDKYLDNQEPITDTSQLVDMAFRKIDGLKDKSKEVLLLKYRENFSIQEIAEILEVSEGTIKSRLHYARLELSAIMPRTELKGVLS